MSDLNNLLQSIEATEDESTGTLTETYYIEASIIDSETGYDQTKQFFIGKAKTQNNGYICTSINVGKEVFFLLNSNGTKYAARMITVIYTKDYDRYSDLDSAKWKMQLSGGGYQTYTVNTGATWYSIQLPVTTEQSFEFQVPVVNLQMTSKIFSTDGDFDDSKFTKYLNCVNSLPFKERARGSVLFDSYSAVLHHTNDGSGDVQWYELTLNFKTLPSDEELSYDWNYQWRNRVQALGENGEPLIWQNDYADSKDYTTVTAKLGKPIWCGEIAGTQAGYGTCGWDIPVYGDDPENDPIYLHPYKDLNDLFEEDPEPEPEE